MTSNPFRLIPSADNRIRKADIDVPRWNGCLQQRILDAAVELFARQGFTGSTTREIARLADVNESSLFRYFPTKRDLFRAAVRSRIQHLRLSEQLQTSLQDRQPPCLVVPLIVEEMVRLTMQDPELVRLLFFSMLELRPGAEDVCREHVAPMTASLVAYFRDAALAGAIRNVDATISTIAVATTVLACQGLHEMLTGSPTPFANSAEAVAAYSGFWLKALSTEPVSSNMG